MKILQNSKLKLNSKVKYFLIKIFIDEELKELKVVLDTKMAELTEFQDKCNKLELQVKNKENNFLEKYDQKKICGEINDLLSENEDLKSFASDLKDELDYAKQRENKLM